MKNRWMKLMGAAVVAVGMAAGATKDVKLPANDAELAGRIAKEVRMYARYTIWDNINIQVRDGNVALTGEVSQPFKKSDLGRIAQSVPGVAGVTNELKVLPVSFQDDRLRFQVARAVYGDTALSRYAYGSLPPIHIIVENGQVTLEGVVNNDMDKQIAGMRASMAGLSFGPVVNNLRVENPSRKG